MGELKKDTKCNDVPAERRTEIWNLSQGRKLQWGILTTVFHVTATSVNTHIISCSHSEKKNDRQMLKGSPSVSDILCAPVSAE